MTSLVAFSAVASSFAFATVSFLFLRVRLCPDERHLAFFRRGWIGLCFLEAVFTLVTVLAGLKLLLSHPHFFFETAGLSAAEAVWADLVNDLASQDEVVRLRAQLFQTEFLNFRVALDEVNSLLGSFKKALPVDLTLFYLAQAVSIFFWLVWMVGAFLRFKRSDNSWSE